MRVGAFALLVVVVAAACGTREAPAAPKDPRVAPFPLPAKLPARLLRSLAHNPDGYNPERATASTDILLGDLLFHSPELLGPKARAMGLSCHSCHPNGAAHTTIELPGLSQRPGSVDLSTPHFRAGAENGVADAINIPSLRGVRYTGPYGRDGRTASLAAFAHGVVVSEFDGGWLKPGALQALVAYLNDLDFLPNPNLDARGRLTAKAGEAARRGEALFEAPRAGFGGASCATCHRPSSYFRDGLVHRMGSGTPASPYSLDDGYETPALLGLAETAPYFHDGSLATLAEVVAWFDRSYALGLSEAERADLTAYLDAVGAVQPTEDDRPVAERLVETFVYLRLLVDGAGADDADVCRMAVDRVTDAMASIPEAPAMADRISAARRRLAALRSSCWRSKKPAAGAEELRVELTRLAADWAGALAAAGN